MFFRLVIFIILVHFGATSAIAGPWLREKGNSFTSLSFSASTHMDARGTGYFEFGITPTTTVGLDLGLSRKSNGAKLGYGTLFMRRALGPTDRNNKFAYEVGLGATYGGPNRDMIPHFKTGFSWGRGIEIRGKSGWATIDGGVLWNLHNYDHVTKIDTTIGVNFNERLTGIVQLNLANQADETFGYFEPSMVFRPRGLDVKLQIGLSTPIREYDNTSLKLGLWREF